MSAANPKLKEADAAYIKGDFPAAKKAAEHALQDESLPEKDALVARQIVKAIDFDPIAAVGFGVTLFILIFLGIKFLL